VWHDLAQYREAFFNANSPVLFLILPLQMGFL